MILRSTARPKIEERVFDLAAVSDVNTAVDADDAVAES